MGLFSHRDPAPKRIRKDAGDLTIEDFRTHPVWEFCLDEEGTEGQTECTVRPSDRTEVLRPLFDGGVRAEIQLASGRVMPGAVWMTLLEGYAPEPRTELWTKHTASECVSDALPAWDSIIYKDCRRYSFEVPAVSITGSDDAAERISLVYKALGVTAAEMWPLTVRPALPIEGLPNSWVIRGWTRLGGPPGVVLK